MTLPVKSWIRSVSFSINLQVFGGHVGNMSIGNLLQTSWLLYEQQRLSLVYHKELLNLPHWHWIKFTVVKQKLDRWKRHFCSTHWWHAFRPGLVRMQWTRSSVPSVSPSPILNWSRSLWTQSDSRRTRHCLNGGKKNHNKQLYRAHPSCYKVRVKKKKKKSYCVFLQQSFLVEPTWRGPLQFLVPPLWQGCPYLQGISEYLFSPTRAHKLHLKHMKQSHSNILDTCFRTACLFPIRINR